MNWEEALDIVIARNGHTALRMMCDGAHPQHAIWRERVVGLAEGRGPGKGVPFPTTRTIIPDAIQAADSGPGIAETTPGSPVDPNPPGYPSLAKMAQNALSAATRAAGAAIQGKNVLVPAEEQERRLAICRGNTCGFYDESQGRCKHPSCGCVLVWKAKIATENCPIGLW